MRILKGRRKQRRCCSFCGIMRIRQDFRQGIICVDNNYRPKLTKYIENEMIPLYIKEEDIPHDDEGKHMKILRCLTDDEYARSQDFYLRAVEKFLTDWEKIPKEINRLSKLYDE